MADRSIVVRLRGEVSDLKSKLAQIDSQMKSLAVDAEAAGKKTDAAGAAMAASSKRATAALVSETEAAKIRSQVRQHDAAQEIRAAELAAINAEKYGKLTSAISRNEQHISKLSSVALGLGAAVGLGVGLAVKTFADFDQAMSDVAATGDDARQNLAALRDEAIQMGADTAFSATEAAQGIENLLKAGVSAKDVLGGGLKGALDLAAAGQLSVADAAEIAATAMTQFGLAGRDVPHIADLLAAGAGKAQGEVSDFADALKYVGPIAHQMGVSLEETVGVIAEFASQGILGQQAGTSMRGMLLSLTSPSKIAADEMKKLGINVYDAQGRFVGFSGVADQLQGAMSGLTAAERDEAFGRIFGNEQITAARVLYAGGGADVRKWTGAVNESGYASQVAATKLDNLKGDLEQLKGSFETALIQSGSGANDVLRELAQGATATVNAIGQLPKPVLEAGLGIAALTAGALLVAGGLGKVIVSASETRAAMVALGISAKGAGLAVAAVTLGITIGASVWAHYAAAAQESKQRVDDLTSALQQSNGALDANVAKTRAAALEQQGALAAAQKLGISIQDVTQASLGNAAAQARVNAALDAAATAGEKVITGANGQRIAYNQFGQAIDTVRNSVAGGNKELQSAQEQYGRLQASTAAANSELGVTSQAAGQAASGIAGVGQSAQDAVVDVHKLAQTLFDLGDAAQASADAHIDFEQAIDDATASVKKNGKTLNDNTQKGRDNARALSNLASRGKAWVQSLVEQGKSTGTVTKATQKARDSFVAAAIKMGLSRTAANKLATAYGLIPKDVKTKVSAPGATTAKTQADKVTSSVRNIPSYKKAHIDADPTGAIDGVRRAQGAIDSLHGKTVYLTTVHYSKTQKVGKANAYGGLIDGYSPGPHSDNLITAITAGEFVHQKPAVDYYGASVMYALNDRRIPKSVLQGYAYGGLVQSGRFQTAAQSAPVAASGGVPVQYGGPLVVQHQTFPDSMHPLTAAAAVGYGVTASLRAIGL